MMDIYETKPKNYFCVSVKVVDRLISLDVSAEQILVYLVLARFAYRTSTKTTQFATVVKHRLVNGKYKNSEEYQRSKRIDTRGPETNVKQLPSDYYITINKGEKPLKSISEFCVTDLPPYMHPSHVLM